MYRRQTGTFRSKTVACTENPDPAEPVEHSNKEKTLAHSTNTAPTRWHGLRHQPSMCYRNTDTRGTVYTHARLPHCLGLLSYTAVHKLITLPPSLPC
ncbi:hypothetical protein PoB_001588000 [Plakobranchus ocellatus]|uniref:Uncharacterized protein n=1 Tax=Plakobranchus ocellatus TaxID=259542 RepID=A0AAV3Z1V6_9GAST|nr:hypothetical protein PoB_001588000 [Plakobranchus ocellatus]